MRTVKIANCIEHGLHGKRDYCFVCGRPVEQIEFVPAEDYHKLRRVLDELLGAIDSMPGVPSKLLGRKMAEVKRGAEL